MTSSEPRIDRTLLERRLAELPLLQYEFLAPETLPFSERIRAVCERECPMYGTTWACPPAVGSVETCRERCLSASGALLLVSAAEVEDPADLSQTLPTRTAHEELTRRAAGLLRACGGADVWALSTEACALCERCSYPGAPCRHPDRMYPCVESHGIVVSELAERFGMEFLSGGMVLWFSLLFYS